MRALIPMVLFATVGCGQSLVTEIRGTIDRNDEPLGHVFVTFWPPAECLELGSFDGMTNEDGQFEIKVDPSRCPAQPGEFRVLVYEMMCPAMLPPEMFEVFRKVSSGKVPPIYGSADTTPLRAELKPGYNELELKVESRRQPRR